MPPPHELDDRGRRKMAGGTSAEAGAKRSRITVSSRTNTYRFLELCPDTNYREPVTDAMIVVSK